MKSILPLLVLVTASFASPVLACERHESHAALKTAEQVPPEPPKIVIEPAAQSVLTSEEAAKAVMSTPSGAAYEGCNRARKGETVYLTQ